MIEALRRGKFDRVDAIVGISLAIRILRRVRGEELFELWELADALGIGVRRLTWREAAAAHAKGRACCRDLLRSGRDLLRSGDAEKACAGRRGRIVWVHRPTRPPRENKTMTTATATTARRCAMNNDVIAANLKRIRRAKGISQDRVAEAAGLSRSAYSNIESGKAQPRVRNLEAFAGALQIQIRELLEPAVELTNVRFRSYKKLRTRNQILTDVGRWLADYNGLEGLLDSHRPFRLQHVAAQAGAGEDRAVAAARAARATLGLTENEPVLDICGLLDSAGVKVFPLAVASDGFFGLSVGRSDGGPAVVVNTWKRISVERWIFSAAHELGHLLLHLDDYGQDAEEEDDAHEREADAFAAEFLMPDRTGRSLSKTDEPAALADSEFMTAAPEVLRGREPDHLSAGDFREDRLARLVRRATEAGEISLGRGAEILGISLKDMRALSASWVG
jgi:transcriptional regulator with XRE-family HTH domain